MASVMVPLSAIGVHANYRDELVADKVERYAADMAANGFDPAHPVEICPNDGMSGGWLIVAGHNRHAAAVRAGLAEIPAVVRDVAPGSLAFLFAQVKENVDRTQTTILEDGRVYSKMVEMGATVEEIAAEMKCTTGKVQRRLAVTFLHPLAQSLAMQAGYGISWALMVEDLPLDLQGELVRALADSPDMTLAGWRLAVDVARQEWQAAQQSAMFDGAAFEMVAAEWSTAAGRYLAEGEEIAAASRPAPERERVLGLAEIAERYGVRVGTAHKWHGARGILPAPDMTVSGSPAWYLSTVDACLSKTGRRVAV